MKNEDGTFGLKYRFVKNRVTGETIVVPPKEGETPLDQSATFYHAARDKGNVTCFDCERPDMTFIASYDQAGSKVPVRSHFKLAHGNQHDPDCLVKMRADDDPSGREIDFSKGPVIFLNGLPERLSAQRKFYGAARNLAASVPLVSRDADGKLRINDEDLDNRRRMNAKTPQDIFRIMRSKSINRELLNDAVIINADKATPWSDFLIRPGDGRREPEQARLIKLVEDMLRQNLRGHAILFNFTVDTPAVPVYKKERAPVTETFRRAGFRLEPPPPKEIERMRIVLPVIDVVHPITGNNVVIRPLVHIKNPDLYAEFSTPGPDGKVGEFFMLAQPYINMQRGSDKMGFLNLELHRPEHVVRYTLDELKASVVKRPAFFQTLPVQAAAAGAAPA